MTQSHAERRLIRTIYAATPSAAVPHLHAPPRRSPPVSIKNLTYHLQQLTRRPKRAHKLTLAARHAT